MPYYKDQKAADALMDKPSIGKAEYRKEDAQLRTNKLIFMDVGGGIVVASATILTFLLITRVKSFADLSKVKSFNRLTIFITSNLIWLLLIPGTYWYYSFRGARGDYPPFADSIAIPIFTEVPLYLFLMIPMNIFLGLTMIGSNLPATVFVKPHNYSLPVILWEIFFGICLLFNLIPFVAFTIDGDHFSVVVNLFFIYILLNLRARQIGRHAIPEEEQEQLQVG